MTHASAVLFLRRFRAAPKAELHLHLEGSVSAATLVSLSARLTRPIFPDPAAVRARRRALGTPEAFLGFYRDVCRLLTGPADYARVARDLTRRLRRENVRAAEVYVSPAIVERIGLPWRPVRDALELVFAAHERRGHGTVRVLLDSVRHWGVGAAERVLDLHESDPWPRVAGFGLGGDETAFPASDFAKVYQRVRRLGLVSLVHAGEWSGPESVAEAIRYLAPVRIAHGIRAIEDPALVRLLAKKKIILDVCPTSNLRTGAAAEGSHPALALLRAGVPVTLSTDDPGLFGTTLHAEYRRLAAGGAAGAELAAIAAFSREASRHGAQRWRTRS